jgi:hypothetical protein
MSCTIFFAVSHHHLGMTATKQQSLLSGTFGMVCGTRQPIERPAFRVRHSQNQQLTLAGLECDRVWKPFH